MLLCYVPPNLKDYLWNFTFSCATAPDCFFVFYKSWLTWILATGDAEEPAEERKAENQVTVRGNVWIYIEEVYIIVI